MVGVERAHAGLYALAPHGTSKRVMEVKYSGDRSGDHEGQQFHEGGSPVG